MPRCGILTSHRLPRTAPPERNFRVSIDFTKPQPQLPQGFAPRPQPNSFIPLPETYYQPSGKAPFGGIVATLGVGLGPGILLAVVYAYILVYLPFVYLRILAPFGYSVGLGFIISLGLQAGKIRNPAVNLLLVVGISLISFYFAWTVWVFAVLQHSGTENVAVLDVLASPLTAWKVILQFNETGVWGIKGTMFSGAFLGLIWLLETIIILFGPMLGGLAANAPFCETCDCWTVETKGVREFKCAVSRDEIKETMRRKDYGRLLSYPRIMNDSVFYRVNVHGCSKCRLLNVLKLEEVHLKLDENGKPSETTVSIIDNLLISPSEMGILQS